MVAAREIPADAFVSIAGPGEPLPKLLLRQLEPGLPPDAYKRAQAIILALEHGTLENDVPELLSPVLRPGVQPYLISAFRYDPADEIAKLKMPVLIIQGERDVQVNADDARLLAKASPSPRLMLLPDMNYVFKVVDLPDDILAAYSDPKKELDPRLVDTISDFVRQLRRSKP